MKGVFSLLVLIQYNTAERARAQLFKDSLEGRMSPVGCETKFGQQWTAYARITRVKKFPTKYIMKNVKNVIGCTGCTGYDKPVGPVIRLSGIE